MSELKRMQRLATGLLILSLALLVAAKMFEPRYPWLIYVAAFAEAATIGGLADWYAVTALFRRPLGLPIPHTAILPANQQRIADSLGDFIQKNFLAPGPVRQKLGETDFSALLIDWLKEEKRAAALAGYGVRLLPQALSSVDGERLRSFMAARMQEAVQRVDISPWLGNLLDSLYTSGRHNRIVDDLIDLLGRLLLEQRSVETVLARIREELPTLLRTLGADGYLLRKIIGSAAAMIEDVKADPHHPLRSEIDRAIEGLIQRLKTSPALQQKIEHFKESLIDRPETGELFQTAWESIRRFVAEDTAAENSVLKRHFTALLIRAAEQFEADAALRAEFNAGMVTVLSDFVEKQKVSISTFISQQVKSWDMDRMTHLIEDKIGRDLQYIRLNGTIIGGLIGLALFFVLRAAGLR